MDEVDFPTLDLGDLGTAIEDVIRSSDEEPDAAPDGEEAGAVESQEDAGTEEVALAADKSEADEAPAAGDDFEARYQERSKQDIAKLQSRYDTQIAQLRRQLTETEGLGRDTDDYVAALEQRLAEWEPESLEGLKAFREQRRRDLARDAEVKTYRQERAESTRREAYARHYPGIDPDHPELAAAWADRDQKREAAILKILVAQRDASPAPVAQPEQAAPKRQAPPKDPETGRFVSQQVAVTQAREQARGLEPSGRGGVVPPASLLTPSGEPDWDAAARALGGALTRAVKR